MSVLLQVDFVLGDMMLPEKKAIYESANIVYVTAPTLAFDYLKNTLATHPSNVILPDLGFAIIDEVDQILIDNAINPYIISTPAPFWGEGMEERIRQVIAVCQGLVRKQLSLTAGPRTKDDQVQLALLDSALRGVGEDPAAAVLPDVKVQTLSEAESFAMQQMRIVPRELCALHHASGSMFNCWGSHLENK